MSIIAVLPLLLGVILVWAAAVKVFSRRGAIAANDAALAKLVGESLAPHAYRALGCGEAAVGLTLLVPIVWTPPAVAAALLTAGFCGYLVYARVATPEASCGCMGGKGAPISWRSFTRSGAMLLASLALLWANEPWTTAFAGRPVTSFAVFAVGMVAFGALSAEFDGLWLVPLRRLRARVSRPLGGDTGDVPLDSTVDQLQRSDVYRHVSGLLRSDVRETWDEDDWRIVCYGASVRERRCTAVFAVPLLRFAPEETRVAIVDDENAETLVYLDSPPSESERPEWALTQESVS